MSYFQKEVVASENSPELRLGGSPLTTHVGRVDAAHHLHLLGAGGKRIATADEDRR